MSFGESLSLRHKLSAITVLSITFTLSLAGVLLVRLQQQTFGGLLEQALVTQARMTEYNCRAALSFDDARSAEETLGALRADQAILGAWIYRKDGRLFASYRNSSFTGTPPASPVSAESLVSEADRLTVVRPILLEKETLGTLVIISNREALIGLMRQYISLMLLVLAFSSVLALAMASGLQFGIMKRIQGLADTVGVVSTTQNFSVRVAGGGKDELGQLIEGFNKMVQEIESRDTTLKRQADELAELNKDLERRVSERTEQLETANKELEAFSYSVAHDLRAPLRHIDGYVDMLGRHLKDSLDDKARRFLTTIGTSAKELGLLVDHLLVFSRMGKTALARSMIHLPTLIEEIRQGVEMTETGRTFEWKIDDLPDIEGDPSLMRLVFTNLLSNAVKYTRHTEKAVIEVRCRPIDDANWEFVVADNGAGFDMKYADKLFGVFQRLHSVKEFEGTGIGLANVRRIVGRHGGRTWAEGAVNQGAKIYFSFPRTEGTGRG